MMNTKDISWIWANTTDDPLRYAFDGKVIIDPRFSLKGEIIPQENIQRTWNNMNANVSANTNCVAYIHIPFCHTHCPFCRFFDNYAKESVMNEYIEALVQELHASKHSSYIQSSKIQAVYIGGGTPSALSSKNIQTVLQAIHECLPLINNYELTIESRLYNFDQHKLKICLEEGANRFSFGVQSFDTNVRQTVARIDKREIVIDRLMYLTSLKDPVISIDLLYGLPFQTNEIWESDLDTLISIHTDGCDLYQLEDSSLKSLIAKGKMPLTANSAKQAEMFLLGVDKLTRAGYQRMNMTHWAGDIKERNLYTSLTRSGVCISETDIIPFGSGATGRMMGMKIVHTKELNTYMNKISLKEAPILTLTAPDYDFHLKADIIGQLECGYLNGKSLKSKHNIDLIKMFSALLNEWQKKGLISMQDDSIVLTLAGQFWKVNLIQALLVSLDADILRDN